MESGPRSAHTPGASPASGPAETRLSTWTPLVNRSRNQQLFEERISLLLHWFDLWNDRQRKHLLHALLTRCTRSQLKICRDWLSELVPVTRVDFTAVLPRLLSLYVMSFLNPRDLCSAAQVNWHWRFLAEQDCLWAGRCVRLGWFLPYSPGEKEYGAWKKHYITCVSTLSWLTPREPAEQYGTLNKPTTGREEEEEREKERRLRQVIREKLQEDKRLRHRNRRAWGSSTQPRDGWSRRGMLGSGVTFKSGSLLSSSAEKSGSTTQFSSLNKEQPIRPSLSLERRPVLNPVSYPPPHAVTSVPRTSPPLLLLISTRIPAYELVLSGLKAEVVLVLYDHRGTLAALLAQVERALGGQQAQRLGLLAPGGTEEVHLLHSISLSEKNVLDPDLREFWEKLCGWVVLSEEGGGVDIFSPFAASESGVALIQTLSTLTGLEVRAPMGLATGSFQNILGEWSHSGVCAGVSNLHICEDAVVPALHYVSEDVLQGWCRQAQWMEEVLRDLRGLLGPQLHRVSLEARGRAMGYFLWERVSLEDLCVSKDATEALTEGLTALAARGEARPMEFLSIFLERWSKEKEGGANNREEGVEEFIMTENCPKRRLIPTFELPQSVLDWRGTIARELFHSEGLYLGRLGAVLKVYLEPLTAALNSNRAILSSAHIHMVLTPVTLIHKLNRLFRLELEARLEQWGAEQCVGDVCLKLCSKLQVYTNYLNNYPTALGTIDKCREKNPAFRAFMKRMDRTLATHMLSLQELLLCPVWRVEEYITLLQALTLHTPSSHPDHTHITSALNTLLQYREFIQKLKQNSERDRLMEETQKMIQGCPNLCEGNRRLIMTWDAALLRSPDEDIPDSLRTFEEVSDVGLFLFTDALVLTERNVCHTPFMLALRSAHSFLASVALASLAVREIAHSRYVSHAFVLEGPRRSWVLAAEGDAERGQILSGLRSAIHTAVTGGASVTGL
ncbi:epithelial cell-transforming sequence 2 oncogene-like isoform X2 [Lampris incognitus]|uniref:epithelial cell-transforming sequence 2 oncogene-like isoform X2 n=1 Tax=Lampris incognitus TaxID=2546036 RepID=UPI0024B4D34E|nr:epithelial cell-transforming sequence 2 oncogene-like isoform X2 [Lampris incognitus]